jgi:Helix-turn-helix of DDE superfamily endonuclease
LLIALEYWREYRTYFHIAQSWEIHESTVCRIVHRVEDELIKSGKFNLPGKKALALAETEWSAVIIDVGESPIERPKKNSSITTVGRKRDIR